MNRPIRALILTLLLSVPLTGQEPNTLSDEEAAEGWLLLFDGETMFGWRPAGKANWRVQDGTLAVDSGDQCLLRTTTQFADYLLRVDFRYEEGTNSGIFLRTRPVPQSPGLDCYELNIAPPDNPFPTGSFVKQEKVSDANVKPGQWHTYEVRADGGRLNVRLDGQEVVDLSVANYLGRGFIGLQHNEGHVAFRNVKLLPLGLKPIFNGTDLTDWKQYPDMESEFTVNDQGWLHVTNGPGQLETTKSYADFVLQLDCMTHADNLNSGIFFRCIPGDVMMGYESQIHNGFVDGDRTNPLDHGTGGIFRRQKARLVVANDQQWFRKTIIANGPHMSVWVDGFQVSDWTDKRPANENPRRGLRTEAGTIMIQGHDPTTDISFRSFRIAEIPARWPADR